MQPQLAPYRCRYALLKFWCCCSGAGVTEDDQKSPALYYLGSECARGERCHVEVGLACAYSAKLTKLGWYSHDQRNHHPRCQGSHYRGSGNLSIVGLMSVVMRGKLAGVGRDIARVCAHSDDITEYLDMRLYISILQIR